jgi:hypothetical protein
VSTFGYFPGTGIFTDQAAHNPGAKYWIPTWDEWLKAAHYDPNKNNGQGGWWKYSTTSDIAPISAPPPSMVGGNGQINAAWSQDQYPGVNPFSIPLGAYPTVTSPWGLLDVAGGPSEWNESIFTGPGLPPTRMLDGSNWVDGGVGTDGIMAAFSDFPSLAVFDYGFRIASSVPAPTSGTLLLTALGWQVCGRRRKSK